jgi:TRAP-type C4-dicarboxylate transport system permease small subunit
MSRFLNAIVKVDRVLYVIAGVTLVVMVLLTLVDVILRNFGHPITGSMEIIQYGGSVVFGFSVCYATFMNAQVRVDVLTSKLKPKPKKILDIVTRVIGIVFFLFVAFNFFLYARSMKIAGEVTASFRLPFYPIIYAISFSFLCQSLTVAVDLAGVIKEPTAATKEVIHEH